MNGDDLRALRRFETDKETRHYECQHGGYNEQPDLTVEPWATLAPLCWDSPSSFRLGWEAEAHGISGNPYKSPFSRGVFDAGRQRCREGGFALTKC
jgi:hypothetical protein